MVITTLQDTVDLMISDHYIDRFIGEYGQTKLRYLHLDRLIKAYEDKTLEFEPDTPIEILKSQLEILKIYVKILENRARYEKIILPEVRINDDE
jgi:hypothetical protein